MNKILLNLSLTILIVSILVLPFEVIAAGDSGITEIKNKIKELGKLAWTILVSLAVVMFVYAGILFLISSGSPDKLGKAKKTFIWGIAGLILGLLAFWLVEIISGKAAW